jgi:hypothetical protein
MGPKESGSVVARRAIEGLQNIGREPENKTGSDERSAAERVRAFMEQKSLGIPAFAKMIGKSTRTVGYVLAGVPVGKDTRVAVAKALGTLLEVAFSSQFADFLPNLRILSRFFAVSFCPTALILVTRGHHEVICAIAGHVREAIYLLSS